MSLVDALFLDPHRFETWVAIRTDGIKGSGTLNDPWNASPKLAAAFSISLTRSGVIATATLAAGHGLQNGDSVVVRGATGPDAVLWNGAFTISNVGATGFQYTMSAAPASSSATGTITAAKVTGSRFDDVMNGLTDTTHVRLGPGLFFTQGYASSAVGGWQIRPRMKITGSGIDITTLRLVNHTAVDWYYAIGHELDSGTKADFCEASDLTIDCNLAGAGAETVCGAVQLMGDHVKIHRVKAIHWGCKDGTVPCSVLSCVTALPSVGVLETVNAGIEECVVMSPGAGNIAACTALHAGNPDSVPSYVTDGHGKTPHILNCFVDCGVTTPNPDPAVGKYRGVSMGWCLGGVIEGNYITNTDIGGPYQEGKRSVRSIIVRNNTYRNVGRAMYWNLGLLGTEVAPGALARSGTVGTVSGLSNFDYFDAGVRVKLVTSPADYTGVYFIQGKAGNTFTITVHDSGTSLVTVTSAKKIFGVRHALVDGNVIELAAVSGAVAIAVADNNDTSPYSELPDYVHGDVIVRNNKIRYVDGAAPNDGGATLIDLRGVKNIVVQNNLLDTVAALPFQALRCGTQSYFDNRTLSGELLTVSGFTANDFQETLEFPSEEAFVLAHFAQH